MKITSELLRETAGYVEKFMSEHFKDTIFFHDYRHTVKVVRVCDMISMESDLSKHERRLVHLAAWFSNIGYKEDPEHHEEHSAKHARAFFETKGLERDDIREIESCILATRAPQHPHTATARILCDAVLYHLADNNYFEELKHLRKEWEIIKQITYSEEDWFKLNINFLTNHFYFTPFARKNFDRQQRDNLVRLKAHLATIKNSETDNKEGELLLSPEQDHLFDSKTKFDRGVETLFRIVGNNQMQLSQMGDGKANILISINSIILSVIITFVVRRLDVSRHLMIPTLLMLIVSVTTIVFAILSTRPKISQGIFTPQQIQNKTVNLLFFGNFYKMPLGEYKTAIKEMMLDKEYLYEGLIRYIYEQGRVLARKYRFTTWAYNVFMFGLIISVIAFIIAFIMYNKGGVKIQPSPAVL